MLAPFTADELRAEVAKHRAACERVAVTNAWNFDAEVLSGTDARPRALLLVPRALEDAPSVAAALGEVQAAAYLTP